MKYLIIFFITFTLTVGNATADTNLLPDLSGLSKDARDSIISACATKKYAGPKEWAKCYTKHLASITPKISKKNFFTNIIDIVVNFFVYYIQPILILIFFLLWRIQKKKNKKS